MTNHHTIINLINSLPTGNWKAAVGGINNDTIFLTCLTHKPLMYKDGQLTEMPIRNGLVDVTDATLFVRGVYNNHQGKISTRTVMPISIKYISTEYHPDQQWILEAFDLDKSANRSFALKDFDFLTCTKKD